MITVLNESLQENYRMGGTFQWPNLAEVLQFRQEVYKVILEVIETAPLELPITMNHPWVCVDYILWVHCYFFSGDYC